MGACVRGWRTSNWQIRKLVTANWEVMDAFAATAPAPATSSPRHRRSADSEIESRCLTPEVPGLFVDRRILSIPCVSEWSATSGDHAVREIDLKRANRLTALIELAQDTKSSGWVTSHRALEDIYLHVYSSLPHEANLNDECSVGRTKWTKTKNSQPQKDGGLYVHSARFVILLAQTI